MEKKEISLPDGYYINVLRINEEICFEIKDNKGMLIKLTKEDFFRFLKENIKKYIETNKGDMSIKKVLVQIDSDLDDIFIIFFNKFNFPIGEINLNNMFNKESYKFINSPSLKLVNGIKIFLRETFDILNHAPYYDNFFRYNIGEFKFI